ncbi:hypothetical protein [Phenylobacterium sp.]|uniref:hypothetical protein n=1 Tax=Phenylobacterium sp. TaxID=1871053 RepID=UPI0026004535|nr:hypothetical protein [Phenylobacterium sp.]
MISEPLVTGAIRLLRALEQRLPFDAKLAAEKLCGFGDGLNICRQFLSGAKVGLGSRAAADLGYRHATFEGALPDCVSKWICNRHRSPSQEDLVFPELVLQLSSCSAGEQFQQLRHRETLLAELDEATDLARTPCAAVQRDAEEIGAT